jgi:hypothetical protein
MNYFFAAKITELEEMEVAAFFPFGSFPVSENR